MMGLENIKKKMKKDKASPYSRQEIRQRPDGSRYIVEVPISREEYMADLQESLTPSPEKENW